MGAGDLTRQRAQSMLEELDTALREAVDRKAPMDLVRSMYGAHRLVRLWMLGDDEYELRSALNAGGKALAEWKRWLGTRP
jgi:hypothetical protein